MKELSIEEKAKRYDEAVNEIKNFRDMLLKEGVINENGIIYNNFNRIFPELKESVDERIRQFLIHEVEETSDEIMSYRNMNKKDVIAWLKKQNSNIDNANKEYWRGYKEGKQEIFDKYAELEKQGEQKTVEWSEEDLICLGYLANFVDKNGDDFYGKNKPNVVKWIRSFAELPTHIPINEIEKNPAWSEEDERMYKAISIALSLKDAKGYLKSWYKTPEEADNWLKSLKERYNWKPSDEQMNNK